MERLGRLAWYIYYCNRNKEFRPFEEAKKYAHGLKLSDRGDWVAFCKSGKKPEDIPAKPSKTYKNKWKGWGDWLGTYTIAVINREFRPFEEARKYVHGLKLKDRGDWYEHCQSGTKPDDIPALPSQTYKNKGWKGWGDWLGTYTIALFNRMYRPFEEAKKFAHGLKFKDKEEYLHILNLKDQMTYQPSNDVYINKGWKSWPDFLGYEETDWSLGKVKELLKGWIESGMIYDEDDFTLFDLLHINGLLHLKGNRHEKFFKNLIEARHSAEGLDAIKKYVNSDLEIPPEFEENEEIETANSEEIAKMVESEINPLDYGKLQTPEEILKQSERLESYSEDSENMQFHVNKHINRLWSDAFRDSEDSEDTYLKVKAANKTGNKYRDEIRETFLTDYESSNEN